MDPNIDFDDLDNDSFQIDESDFVGSELDDYHEKIINTEYLSNVDYSLNSPLIADEIIEYIKFFKGLSYRKAWDNRIWTKRKEAAKYMKYNITVNKGPEKFHSWFAGLNLKSFKTSKEFRNLIQLTQEDSDQTFPIVNAFFKAWLNEDINNIDKTKYPTIIDKWGTYFLDFHIITLLLNARSRQEIEELGKVKGVTNLNAPHCESSVYTSINFGRVLITCGFTTFLDQNIILDRNTVLMCKDTYVARFQTQFSMVNRADSIFKSNDINILTEIYKIGDIIIASGGNNGYDCIKFVEPICLLRVAELARDFRPLIPEFTSFKEHVLNSINELSQQFPSARSLYDKIMSQNNHELVLTVYGSFRHWGHPYLDYLDGLESVHEQVTMSKEIDRKYADALGSDLAFLVLQAKFRETKRWFVKGDFLEDSHMLKQHITENTWPTPKQIIDFGDNWHKLPLMACFDVPDMIDPAIIYSDKSHSMNRSEILTYISRHPVAPVPSRKVLQTFITKPATNWKDFLTEVNNTGLTSEDLVIGLKGKEREVKVKGRFFTLMSWRLREYFVVTEYLIKSHFVPLFKGLTMADDLNTVTKKLMDNTTGQGNNDYSHLCIANHIDYTKWNNHQRHEANYPVFRVMGQFLGYPSLISRTHEFFQKSLVYYSGRPDLMRVEGNTLVNTTGRTVCWNGQDGGLEGLRQKGWSVVNLLVIRRESINQNTKIGLLAQGDNQVICTHYKLQKTRTDSELKNAIDGVIRNNKRIMNSIEEGTMKLGLIINKDETLQSADFLVYGKVPIYRGGIMGLETKRWSRVTCVTNDQLPNISNTLSTINSNALTVAHFSTSPRNAIIHYNFLGNFARNLITMHNPALRSSIPERMKCPCLLDTKEYKAAVLYLDPCLGGACGMSLTRFLIRNFPDPVTESLTFWRSVHNNGTKWVKSLAVRIGNPKLGRQDIIAFKKLIEDPLSLNIPGGMNPNTVIKEEIRNALIKGSAKIKNEVVKSALGYLNTNENHTIEFLRSIKPLFPRFISEYMSSTYIGIVRSLIGLFQNSKTIRTVFSRRIDKRIKKIIIDSEIKTVTSLCKLSDGMIHVRMWECSSTKADLLRRSSWGSDVVGATIPHPMELLSAPIKQGNSCFPCTMGEPDSYYISTLVPQGLRDYKKVRGPYKAYLGSRTSESTSILQPWERETKVPLIKRAVKLRNSIGWFVDGSSTLGLSILQNIEALTGEDWSNKMEGGKRTGSALHRFSCSRQSSAGYAAQSPSKLTWMCSTTDTLSTLNSVNHDFMHQSLLIYAQATISEIMDGDGEGGYFHNHIKCKGCLREIKEVQLSTHMQFHHPDVSGKLEQWKPASIPWSEKRIKRSIKVGPWTLVRPSDQSYHIGRAEGFLFGDLTMSNSSRANDPALFPLTIQKKVIPNAYLQGILDGLIRAASIHCISRRAIVNLKRPREALLGTSYYLIKSLSRVPAMITLWRTASFESLFLETPYKVPASYPLSNDDLGSLGENYLRTEFRTKYLAEKSTFKTNKMIWIFTDINDPTISGLLGISTEIVNTLYGGKFSKFTKDKIRKFKDRVIELKDTTLQHSPPDEDTKYMRRTDQEIRHACKEIYKPVLSEFRDKIKWSRELCVTTYGVEINYVSNSQFEDMSLDEINIPRIQNPLISGMRTFQFATGSHYKIQSILASFQIKYQDALCGGDGSGGIGSFLLRSNGGTRLIFNSLLKLDNVDLRGTTPSPPSAIYALGKIANRCVNLRDAWENSNDLRSQNTWDYFAKLKKTNNLTLDLVIIDAECAHRGDSDWIEDRISVNIFKLLEQRGTLIYKTYLNRLLSGKSVILNSVGNQFSQVTIVYTDISSSQTSEVYVVMSGRRTDNINVRPDLSELIGSVEQFPVYRSTELEFERALRLKKLDMYKGVPNEVRSDPFDDLQKFLESINIETGLAAILSEMSREGSSVNFKGTPLVLLMTVINSLIPMTHSFIDDYPPPSDSTVYNLGIFIVGYLNWTSLCETRIIPHKNAQRFINECFRFSWKDRTVSSSRANESIFDRHYSFTGKYTRSKNFYLDSNMAKIGEALRVLIRAFGFIVPNQTHEQIDHALRQINTGLTTGLLFTMTDIYDLFIKDLPSTSVNPDSPTDQEVGEALEEAAYTS